MTPTAIIQKAAADGVSLSLSHAGTIKAIGDKAAMNRWLAVIREHKAEIIDVLKVGTGDTATDPMTPADARLGKVIDKLHADTGLRYAMEAHIDADPDAVILTLAIRGKGACELRIPKSRYDAVALLELIEKHTTRETLQ